MSVDLKLISGGFRYDDDRDRRMQKLALAIAEKALEFASTSLRTAFPVDSGAYDLAVTDIERLLRCVKDEIRYQHTLDEWQQGEGE